MLDTRCWMLDVPRAMPDLFIQHPVSSIQNLPVVSYELVFPMRHALCPMRTLHIDRPLDEPAHGFAVDLVDGLADGVQHRHFVRPADLETLVILQLEIIEVF